MFDYIQKIQQKSVQERKRFALIVAFTITAVIFFFWLSAQMVNGVTAPDSPMLGEINPIPGVKDTYEDVAAGVSTVKETFSLFKGLFK
jgi:hypothetical protein